MNRQNLVMIPLVAGCVVLLAALLWIFRGARTPRRFDLRGGLSAPTAPAPTVVRRPAPATVPNLRDLGARLLTYLRETLEREDARANEAILTFKDADAYRRFLERARESGLTVLGELGDFLMARVRYDSLDALQKDIVANAEDFDSIGANYILEIPTVPTPEVRTRALSGGGSVGNRLLGLLGIAEDRSEWGRGVSVAILDSGVAPGDPTLASAQARSIDIGLGVAPGTGGDDGHGTAVAGLVAGSAADAPGIAPASSLLSIRVTGPDGTSDVFTMAQGIRAAVDAGANVINISMGGYQTGVSLLRAIEYAYSRGVVIVASAGNDQAAQLTWPAADPRVISVGAVDSLEQQVLFSNSGTNLKLSAPGLGVPAAWLDGLRINLDGTSASAPLVAGAIAAIMSTSSGISAADAVQILLDHANDGGAAGTDSDYGAGVLNVGWAMSRSNVNRVDNAISSHSYNPATGEMQFVIQNRGAQVTVGLELSVSTGGTTGATTRHTVPALKAGGTYVVRQSIDQTALATAGRLVISTSLSNPDGPADQVPANNRKTSALSAPSLLGGN